MRRIPLVNSDLFAFVDNEDYELVTKYRWRAIKGSTGILYASNGTFAMHRLVMNWPGKFMVDHKDRNGLNNRKNNLRLCTNSQNQANAKRRVDNTTGYKGVQIDKHYQRLGRPSIYRASIMYNGKLIRIGRFKTAEEAKLAYDTKSKELFGEFGRS